MSYILSAQRDNDVGNPFDQYSAYIDKERHQFPPRALALIDSGWYFGFSDHRAPHDARLEDVRVSDVGSEEEDSQPSTTIRIRLLGAYHDGIIELTYSDVIAYSLGMTDLLGGHRDWRYDEFRVSDAGSLIHEIEWWGGTETGRWLIEARDVTHSWHPFAPTS